MAETQQVRGSCNCGRNHYLINIPTNENDRASVYFDDSRESRRSQAAPITAWLRVPLTWYSSTTIAQLPDETHTSIRRICAPIHEPSSRRIFCGYCGTHLSLWTEEPAAEAEFLNVTLGSLSSRSMRLLEELDMLSEETEEGTGADFQRRHDVRNGDGRGEPAEAEREDEIEATKEQKDPHGDAIMRSERRTATGDMTWFEEMINGSRLGRTQRTRRGQGVSADGNTTITYEVSEYVEDGGNELIPNVTPGRAKRKIADVVTAEDSGSDL